MKVKTIELALNCPVELIDFENDVYQGWLVKDKKCYLLLPFSESVFDINAFRPSHIKSIKHLSNGKAV